MATLADATKRPSHQRATLVNFDLSPLLVFYELTQACDLACLHCRASAQCQAHPAELSTSDSLRLIDQLTQFPTPPMLVLTGGDPLKRSDIFELVERGAGAGLEVSITPSATPLVTREAILRLRDSGIARLAVSIDGADASTHDAFRGTPGSFQRSLEILADARDAGIPLQINTTLTAGNVEQIEVMGDLFASLSITLWSVFFLVPVGRAGGSSYLAAEDCEAAFARLWRQSRTQPFLLKTTEAPHYRRYALQQERQAHDDARPVAAQPFTLGVNDGKGVMFVSHMGQVFPSGFMPIHCGRFPRDSLVNIYQNSPVFRALRDANQLEGKCGLCEYRRVCGGSRARSYALTGDPLAAASDCVYVPQNFHLDFEDSP